MALIASNLFTCPIFHNSTVYLYRIPCAERIFLFLCINLRANLSFLFDYVCFLNFFLMYVFNLVPIIASVANKKVKPSFNNFFEAASYIFRNFGFNIVIIQPISSLTDDVINCWLSKQCGLGEILWFAFAHQGLAFIIFNSKLYYVTLTFFCRSDKKANGLW